MEKCLLLMTFLTGLCAFNIDVKDETVVELKGTPNSHFGYSVALRKTLNDMKVIVGAPHFEIDGMKTGRLYGCNLPLGICNSISDEDPSKNNGNKEERAEQALGMSITSINESILATAPRWKTSSESNTSIYYRGKSYVYYKDNLKFWYDVNPCEDVNEIYGKRNCLTGLSSSGVIFRESPFYIVGVPGAEFRKGSLMAFFKRRDSKKEPFIIRSSRASLNDSLMGYSVTTGRFTVNPTSYITHVVGGAPRASNMQGNVMIFTLTPAIFESNPKIIECPDDQIGTYFGAAVCAVDVNNDGKDDLLIAAPYYTFKEDEGVVYVYLNRGDTYQENDVCVFDRSKHRLEGEKQRQAKFGTSITNIGDINKDGYNDVAIGAPYGGPDKKGAVYIYNGGKDGIKKYSQVIYARDLPSSGGGFGISLSGQVDVDNNKYPDLVVGAYKDSRAYVFRTRPVIRLYSAIRTSVNAIPTTTKHNDNFKCNGLFPSGYKCITVFIDLKYFGESTPDNLDFDITIDCDAEKRKKGAFLAEKITTRTQKVTLEKDKQTTVNFTVGVLLSTKTNVKSPIIFTATFEEYVDPSSCPNAPCAMFDEFSSKTASYQITYSKGCASESVCKPNLVVTANVIIPKKGEEKIIYGREYEFAVTSKVENLGENAFNSFVKMNFSSDLTFNRVEVNKKASSDWEEIGVGSNTQLNIAIGNPLREKETVEVILIFSVPEEKRPTATSYTFSMEASSFGEDTNPENNKASVNVDTKIEYCIVVQSDSKPNLIVYNYDELPAPPLPPAISDNTLNDSVTVDVIGREVNYTFHLRNDGKLRIENLKASIEVVVQKNNLDFIYVVYLTANGIECKDNDLNSLNYTSQYPQSSKRNRGIVSCRGGGCKIYVCEINEIESGTDVTDVIIEMVTRVWDHNLAKIDADSVEIEIKVDFVGPQKDWYMQRPGCDRTSTVSLAFGKPRINKVAWWEILLAVLGAFFLLTIIIIILYKVGFFKRKRNAENITEPNEVSHLSSKHPDDSDDNDDDDEK